MRIVLRVLIYAVLIAGALVFGRRFVDAYSQRLDAAAHRYDLGEIQQAAPDDHAETNASQTNQVATLTLTNPPSAGTPTNTPIPATNAPSDTETAGLPARQVRPAEPQSGTGAGAGSHLGLNAAMTLAAVIGLALLLAQDVSRYLAERAHRSLHDDEGKVMVNPEYDQAEQVWANGDYLEAIRLMREFLKKNPRQVHVALRIAEIYEKDLANNLAAALEYEEILKFKLDPERWGWAAIHLCNLYNRISQPAKAEALLRRIVDEYGETAAAEKARERLGTIEQESPVAKGPEPSQPDTNSGLKLPPGFRPKKH